MSGINECIDVEVGWPGVTGGHIYNTTHPDTDTSNTKKRKSTQLYPTSITSTSKDTHRMKGSVVGYLAATPAAESAIDTGTDQHSSPTSQDTNVNMSTNIGSGGRFNIEWWQNLAIYSSLFSNVALLIIKIIALAESNSIAMLAAVLDSTMDILAGFILFMASRVRRSTSTDSYPIGKRRVSPIATLIFACIMAMAAVQVVIEASTILIVGYGQKDNRPTVSVSSVVIGIVVATISIKLFLAVLCITIGRWKHSTIISAYAQDHLNDTLTNTVSIIGLLLAGK